MRIVSATTEGFRNLKTAEYIFSPQVNLVLGRNGEGKTNFLEALNYFALGRSHRSSRADELIAFDKETLHVRLDVTEESGQQFSCEFGLDRSGARRYKIDGDPVRKRVDLVGRLATVFFDPASLQLVRGGPRERRHFVDQGLAEIDPVFLDHLGSFQRVLKQKSGLLRDLRKGAIDPAGARSELKAWNLELARHAAEVCLGRRDYAALAIPFAQETHNSLIDKDLKFEFIYRPQLESLQKIMTLESDCEISKRDLAEEIFKEIDYIMESEIRRGRPLAGPQLDDLEVRLDGLDLRVFGSQGETRSAAISLILARSDVLFLRRQVRPVLFFDDIFSELDRERARRLQDMACQQHQVFIATARSDDVAGWQPDQVKAWRVESGTLVETDPAF